MNPLAGTEHRNRRLLVRLWICVLVMFGFSWALIPFYRVLCNLTGLTRRRHEDAQSAVAPAVSMRFDATVQPGLPWQVRPLTPAKSVRPGIFVTVEYEITNASNHQVIGQAIPHYIPEEAAAYVKKIDCFCFRQQAFGPGETRRLPVVFVLDRALPREIRSITLAYTLFNVAG